MKHSPGYPYKFDPQACRNCPGRCCNGERGHVWVTREEIESIAKFLGITTGEFILDYLRKINGRNSIKDMRIGDNYSCVFFDEDKNGCSIYPVRPEQCRTFPFWPYFKAHPDKVFKECPGIFQLTIDD